MRPCHQTPDRPTRAGLSTILLVGLLIGVSVSALRPGTITRDSSSEGTATRQLTATLARAVRQLVGSDVHRPMAPVLNGLPIETSGSLTFAAASFETGGVRMLMDSLLSLPPPVV